MKTKRLLRTFLALPAILFAQMVLAHTSYPDTVNCPIDGKEFVINVTMSYTTFGTYKDFQKHGAIGDLYESYVNSCPQCHYSGYQKDIDTTFSEATKQDILKILEPYKNVKMNDVIENEIAIQIHHYFKRGNDDIAWLYLVASYFLRNDTSMVEKRKELQRNSAEYLIKAIDNKEYKDKSTYASMQYLVGELYRRTGDFTLAVKYYDLALADKHQKDWLKKVAQEQKEMALKENDDNSI